MERDSSFKHFKPYIIPKRVWQRTAPTPWFSSNRNRPTSDWAKLLQHGCCCCCCFVVVAAAADAIDYI